MGQLLVRGLNDKVIEALKERAKAAGRSVEAEHRAILEEALPLPTETFVEAAARVRALSPRSGISTTEIIRAFRDGTWDLEDADKAD